MREKLDKAEYSTALKFYNDFKLMLSNCFTYNAAGSLVHTAGLELQRIFEEKWVNLPPLRPAATLTDDEEEDEEDASDEERHRESSALEM